MSDRHHHHHGSTTVGRTMVVVIGFIVLAANAFIYTRALAFPYPPPTMQVAMIISVVWMVAGAWGLCRRRAWGRALVLTILYAGAFWYFVTAVIVIADANGPVANRLLPMFIGTVVYLVTGLVLTNSKHVRRLSSRTWE
jgi:hypothetical protein